MSSVCHMNSDPTPSTAFAALNCGRFDDSVVKEIFASDFANHSNKRLQFLIINGYLENYLWLHYSLASCSLEHTLSIAILIVAKCNDSKAFTVFDGLTNGSDAAKFELLFSNVRSLCLNGDYRIRCSCISFLIKAYQALGTPAVRTCVLPFLSLPLWRNLSASRLHQELSKSSSLRNHWEHQEDNQTSKKSKATDGSAIATQESNWMFQVASDFLDSVRSIDANSSVESCLLDYLELVCELFCDLISQLPTRRFFVALLDDLHLPLICKQSTLYSRSISTNFVHLVNTIDMYVNFNIDNQSGRPYSPSEIEAMNVEKIHQLQRTSFELQPKKLIDLVYSSSGELGKREILCKYLRLLEEDELVALGDALQCVTARDKDYLSQLTVASTAVDADKRPIFIFVIELILEKYCYRVSLADTLNSISLYPTDELLLDSQRIPENATSYFKACAFPKLNLQFLTLQDYLFRNFCLYRIEYASKLKSDLVDIFRRLKPRAGLKGPQFSGWSRVAIPLGSCSVDEVGKPLLGEVIPRIVKATAEIDLARFTGEILSEWESLREHDVVFLISVGRPHPDCSNVANKDSLDDNSRDRDDNSNDDGMADELRKFGIEFIRGAEVFEYKDEDDVVLNDFTRPDARSGGRVGTKRKLRVRLDSAQYYADVKNGHSFYDNLNVLVRVDSSESNFKGVLETIKSLMNDPLAVANFPSWLLEIFIGYGNPSASNYRKLLQESTKAEVNDYLDAFIDSQHLLESFPYCDVSTDNEATLTPASAIGPRCRLSFVSSRAKEVEEHSMTNKRRVTDENSSDTVNRREQIVVNSYKPLSLGPLVAKPGEASTSIRFTPAQIEAIRSGVNPGLTLIIGPPGTGKTDVAVQIIQQLYHNYPSQKILLVTHSNSGLNDLFSKLMAKDVDRNHMLRLGSGEQSLRGDTVANIGDDELFSQTGRVNWSLERRLQLLSDVQRLATSLGTQGDVGYSCETAGYYYTEHIQPRIQRFNSAVSSNSGAAEAIIAAFPFRAFYELSGCTLITGDAATDSENMLGSVRYIEKMFSDLASFRAFELLRTQAHRSDYLLTKQARIVAMTCTYAAINRQKLINLNFKYDSVIMEESAQILEIESLIPLLLQTTSTLEAARLKRVVMIGDHYQLPPVTTNPVLQKQCKLDQSMFARFIRLGAPAVLLDKQGRSRPEIADLYRWRYQSVLCNTINSTSASKMQSQSLQDLKRVCEGEYTLENAGFRFTHQLVDVLDFQGKGEFAPTPYYYQNLGEAEYVIAVYQYMRLLGYPREKISVLTTYNGQRKLLYDVACRRCQNQLFGMPIISTVDKYQGQQNDYILLSLVRTKTVGHLQDVRRLVVAMSRARLGLYVFCRKALFESSFDLAPAFKMFLQKPTSLELVVGESFPSTRVAGTQSPVSFTSIEDVTAMGVLVYRMVQQSQHMLNTAAVTASSTGQPEVTKMEQDDPVA